MSSIFISHASADADGARATARRLEAWGYRSLFLDFDVERGIAAGADWEAQLYRQLKLSRAVVALVTDSFVASQWCFAEVVQARSMGKPVFPLKLAPCAPPALLADVQIVDLTRNEEEGWDRLRRGLEAAGLSEDFPFDPARPYPGLMAFDAADAGVFHGREEEQAAVIELLERMKRRGEPRLALVLGASGSGKSSLVRAGVLPRLGKDSQRWLIVPPFRPGDAPVRELARALADSFGEDSRSWRTIAGTLEADSTGREWVALADDLRETKGRRSASVLVVIDQMEELFTRGSRGEATDAAAIFRAQLRAALEAPGTPLFVVATLRSDFLDSFQLALELRGLAFETLPLGPMPVERLPRVITGPAARAGLELEDGLVERLVADTGSGEALPLLAFTLRQLWERRHDRFTVELYERELGSIDGAVATIAEGIVTAGPGGGDEEALRSAFLQMIRLDDEGRFARQRVAWTELPERSRPVLERFVDERLLVSNTVEGVRHVEIAHEALFRAWRRLAVLLEEERELLHFRQRLDRARAEWSRVSRAEEALLQGPALAEAERWRHERPDDLTVHERAFVDAGIAHRDRVIRAIRRRRRMVEAGVAAGLVLSVVAGWQWRVADQQRRLDVARQLTVQATARLDASGVGLHQSLLLATESLHSAWTADGYAAWARAVALAPHRPEVWIDTGGAAVVAVDYHPVEKWVALVVADGVVRIADAHSGATLRTLPFVDRPLDPPAQWPGAVLEFSADGSWLAAAGQRRLSIWNTRGWQRWDALVNTDGFFDIAFDRTSERLALSGYGQPLRVVEVASKRDLLEGGGRPDVRKFRAVGFTATHLVTALRTGAIAFWELHPAQPALRRVRQTDLVGDGIHGFAVGSTGNALAVIMDRAGLRFWPAAAIDEAFTSASSTAPGRPDAPEDAPPDLAAAELDKRRGSWRVETPPSHTIAFGSGDNYIVTSAATAGAATATFDAVTRLWDVGNGREAARIYPGGPAAFAPAGDSLVAGGAEAGVWRLPARGSAGSLGHSSRVNSVAFSPDGRWLAAGVEDGTVVVRRLGALSDPVALKLNGAATAVGFTPDSRWLVAQSTAERGAALHVFRTETWEALPSRAHEAGFNTRVSSDSRFLLTHTPSVEIRSKGLTRASRSRVWDLSSVAEIAWRSHEKDDRPSTGKISIDEGTLPLGEHGDTALLNESGDWPELRPVATAAGGMNYAVASSDGRWLAGYGSGASEGLALLEPATSRRVVMLRPSDVRVPDAAFSPDGRWLASAEDTSVDLWLLGPVDALIADACTRLSRNLTDEEWSMFGSGRRPVTCERLRLPPSTAAPREKPRAP